MIYVNGHDMIAGKVYITFHQLLHDSKIFPVACCIIYVTPTRDLTMGIVVVSSWRLGPGARLGWSLASVFSLSPVQALLSPEGSGSG